MATENKIIEELEDEEIQRRTYNPKGKGKYWCCVMYPDTMVPDWQNSINELLELPNVYCIHNACVDKNGNPRIVHVHVIIAFPNTTTGKYALSVFQRLSIKELKYCEPVINIRHKYDYLIHATEDAKKKKKHLYDASERICGNGFDIGNYEQISLVDKRNMRKELSRLINKMNFRSFKDMDNYVIENLSDEYYDEFVSHQGYYANLVRGYYNSIRSELSGESDIMEAYINLKKEKANISEEDYRQAVSSLRKAYNGSSQD